MIVRLKKANRQRWTVVSTQTLNDVRLGLGGLGLLIYLLAKPDDWEVHTSQLASTFGVGRDKIRRILRQLEECGYAKLELIRDKDGKLAGKRWVVFEEPQSGESQEIQSPCDSHRAPENTDVGVLPTSGISGDLLKDLCSNLEIERSTKKNTLGASNDEAPSRKTKLEIDIDHVIGHHNRNRKQHWSWVRFRPLREPRKFIRARLKEGRTVEECLLVSDYLAAKWGGNAQHRDYFNLKTPFRSENFERFLAEAEDWDARGRPPFGGTKAQIDPRTQIVADLQKRLDEYRRQYRLIEEELALLRKQNGNLSPADEERKKELIAKLGKLEQLARETKARIARGGE